MTRRSTQSARRNMPLRRAVVLSRRCVAPGASRRAYAAATARARPPSRRGAGAAALRRATTDALDRCQWPAAGLLRGSAAHIPQVRIHDDDGRRRRRVLVLCTGGTLTMTPTPNGLAPVQGALTEWMAGMRELQQDEMPEVAVHEYSPRGSSFDESRRRRGYDVDIPWRRVAATPWLRRGYSVEETNRGDAGRGNSVETGARITGTRRLSIAATWARANGRASPSTSAPTTWTLTDSSWSPGPILWRTWRPRWRSCWRTSANPSS